VNTIDFNKAITETDWKNTYQSEDGTFFRKYECQYLFQNKPWGLKIWARNIDECKERMMAISNGEVLGLVIEEIKHGD
jgi:hypothetical protein